MGEHGMFKDALMNLRAVLKRLSAVNLKLKPKKCAFFRMEMEYLGHKVLNEGMTPSPVAMLHRMGVKSGRFWI